MCLLLLAGGCRRQQPAPRPDATGREQEVSLRDQAGRLVALPQRPQRIVSLAPSTTETLFALGVGDRVAGVTAVCNYPPEAQRRVKVGDFRLNVERIISLDPDLVVAVADLQSSVIEALDRAGAPLLVIDPYSFDDLYAAIRLLGNATGAQRRAEGLVTEMREARRRIRGAAARVPEQQKPKVFIEIGDRPLRTAGPNTFVSQIVEDAGGRNIASDVRGDWGTFSHEAVIARNPEVIITTIPGDVDGILHREGWEAVSAVRTRRVHAVNPDIVVRPGPRLKEGLEAVFELLRPQDGG
jgi:iron complex transport system substrate-binding protein